MRRLHAAALERLRRARQRRKIVLRKAQLLDVRRRSLSPPSGSRSLKQRAAAEKSAKLLQPAAVTAAAAIAAGPSPSKSKRSSFISTRLDACSPKSPGREAQAQVGATALRRCSPQDMAPPRNNAAAIDVPVLLQELIGRGALSSVPRPPPWPQEQPGWSDLDSVRGWITSALPTVEVRSVYRVECTAATSVAYSGVSKTLGPERLLWHGTVWEAVANITQNGFNRAYSGRHGSKLGRGSYFAEDAAYALRFCGRSQTTRALFLAGVLPGRFCRGEEGLVEPPVDAGGMRYDSTVDDTERPKVFCVFRDFQALPLYVAEVATAHLAAG